MQNVNKPYEQIMGITINSNISPPPFVPSLNFVGKYLWFEPAYSATH
jgi:hypothetical protein